MLPQLPIDVVRDRFAESSSALSSLDCLPVFQAIAGGSGWTWAIGGAVLAVATLWTVRKARRMAIAAAIGVAGLLIAWNAGFLPLSA
jgi:CHASE2 domain-containing sensor protein